MADIADIANDRAQVMLDAQLASRKRGGGVVVADGFCGEGCGMGTEVRKEKRGSCMANGKKHKSPTSEC